MSSWVCPAGPHSRGPGKLLGADKGGGAVIVELLAGPAQGLQIVAADAALAVTGLPENPRRAGRSRRCRSCPRAGRTKADSIKAEWRLDGEEAPAGAVRRLQWRLVRMEGLPLVDGQTIPKNRYQATNKSV